MGIFNKSKEKTEIPNKAAANPESAAMQRVFTEALEKMRGLHVERAVFHVQEAEPSKNTPGGCFIDISGSNFQYYPYETLNQAEKKLIAEGKSYQAYSLILKDGHCLRTEKDGVSAMHRTRMHWLLPKMVDSWDQHYSTEIYIYSGESLEKFSKMVAESGGTAENLKMALEQGIREYMDKTRELLKEAGVYAALERLSQGMAPIEQIFSSMREQIEKAKN